MKDAIRENLLSYSPEDLAEKCEDWSNPEIDQAIKSSTRRMRDFSLISFSTITVMILGGMELVDGIAWTASLANLGVLLWVNMRNTCRQNILKGELEFRQQPEMIRLRREKIHDLYQ